MKQIIILLMFLGSLNAQEGSLNVGGGITLKNLDVDSNTIYTVYIGGEFKSYGLEMSGDIRNGRNYISEKQKLSVDTRWAIYFKADIFDLGMYIAVNSTAFQYDGWTIGPYFRMRVKVGEASSLFARFTYPIRGSHSNIITGGKTKVIWGEFEQKSKRLRSTEKRFSIGINIRI